MEHLRVSTLKISCVDWSSLLGDNKMKSVDVSLTLNRRWVTFSLFTFYFSVIFSLYAKDINSVVTKEDVINYTTKYADGWNLENISNLFDEVT